MSLRIPIIYQDDDLVAVDKPAGMPARALAGDPYPGDVLRAAQAQLGLSYLATPQRPESEGSGVLLFAARPDALEALIAAFAREAAQTVYLAIVHGAPPQRSGTVDAPLVREPGEVERYRVTAARDKRAQPAVTTYRVVETAPDGRYSLLEVITSAASGHPLRAHLARLGVPLVGDQLYASGSSDEDRHGAGQAQPAGRVHASRAHASAAPSRIARPPEPAPRLALHAYRLTVPHPGTGQPVTFTAESPALFTHIAAGLPELALAAVPRPIRRLKPGSPGLRELVELALERRAPLAGDPGTTIYRLINGAADGLPGLAVDRYGESLVANVYVESGRLEPLAPGLAEMLAQMAGTSSVYVKYRQREAARVEAEAVPALAPALPLAGPPLNEHRAFEGGLAYLVRPGEGWNPGIFPDMREMRARIRAWAQGRRILNCFAYTCAFGVAATAGGASQTVNLDVSRPLLERGRANYRANNFDPRPDDFLYGDAFDWLPRLAQAGERFDMVILDPPGFARTKTHTFSAAQDYGKLSRAAAAVLGPGGLLVACCNVADLSWPSFRDRVVAGLDDAWRSATVDRTYGAPALDFPASSGRQSYLKILVSRLD